VRGRATPLADGTPLVATIHPSYLLRIQDHDDKTAEYGRFVADLRLCAKLLEKVA
jgi:DNA polymerase